MNLLADDHSSKSPFVWRTETRTFRFTLQSDFAQSENALWFFTYLPKMSFRQKLWRLSGPQASRETHVVFPLTTRLDFRMSAQGIGRGAPRCMLGWRRTAVFSWWRQCRAALAKMAEAAAVPPHRFFCHCCKGEVNPKLPVSRTLLPASVWVIPVCGTWSWHVCACLELRLFCLLARHRSRPS